MATSGEKTSSSSIAQIRFVGTERGAVKTLRGFKKNVHTVPDAVNATTSAFLARLCTDELAEEAEDFFQRVRAALGYKRKELSLGITSPTALLQTRDFTFELSYALAEDDPAAYVVEKTLHSVRSSDLLRLPEFEALFAGKFGEIGFLLKKSVRIDAVIDAVEELDDAERLRVDYPSDCRECTVKVEGVSAEVKFFGGEIRMVFPKKGSPGELFDAFAAVRHAFHLTKDPALAGLFA